MDRFRRGNKQLIKDLNEALVIDQVRRFGPISRKDIAINTSLGASTVTYIVDSLLKEKYFTEIGSGISDYGRKPVLLQFNQRRSYIIAIKIEEKQIIYGKFDLNARMLDKISHNFNPKDSVEAIFRLMSGQISKWIAADTLLCSGIGIAAPGLVDQANKKIIHSPILEWEEVDFSKLEEEVQVPVYLENDANAIAHAELWDGRGEQFQNFICVTIGAGVGAGIVVKNEIYRGEVGGAGEIGHIIIQRDGFLCYCGQRGCLEAYTSDRFIMAEVLHLKELKLSPILNQLEQLTMDSILQAADSGDELVQDIYRRVGENLGIGLKSIVNFFNPGAIVLGGEGLRAKKYIMPALQKELEDHFFSRHSKKLEIILIDLEENQWLMGAAAMVITQLFKEPLYREV
ncbi:MAG: ROK family protein [Desulfitobacteriaceae bacterium]|nr:ROK family protein [Desulfitobacteriaceae bacterium]